MGSAYHCFFAFFHSSLLFSGLLLDDCGICISLAMVIVEGLGGAEKIVSLKRWIVSRCFLLVFLAQDSLLNVFFCFF